jgi:hypothetical protein
VGSPCNDYCDWNITAKDFDLESDGIGKYFC